MKKKLITVAFAVLVFLLALGMTLYPLISNIYNERHQSQIHTHYAEQVEQADDEELRKAKQLAVAYNEGITPGTAETDSYSQASLAAAAEHYDDLLNVAGDGIMCYVEAPSIEVYLPVYHGTDSESLERGVGHLLGSSLPVGGCGTHTILTGHSGVASQKLFSDLPLLQKGDVFYIHVLNEVLAYQVDQINTVLPHDTSLLGISQGEDLCTLITCTPFGVNTHRLLVRGSRIPYEQAVELQEKVITATQEQPISDWEAQYLQGILYGFLAALAMNLIIALPLLLRKRGRGHEV